MLNKSIKFIENCNITLLFLSVFFIMFMSRFSFYWADDYSIMLILEKNGVLRYCIDGYFNWDGRSLTFAGFFQGVLLKYIKVEYITLIWSLLFIISGYLMSLIIFSESKYRILESKKIIIFTLSIILIFWLSCYKNISETIYWATGGVYTLNLFLSLLWIVFFNNIYEKKNKIIVKIFFLVFSFFVGATTQNLTIPLLLFIFFTTLIDFLSNKTKLLFYNILVSLFLIIGLIYITFAPGNIYRIRKTGNGKLDLNLLQIIKNFYILIVRHFNLIIPLILIFVFIIIYLNTYKNVAIHNKDYKNLSFINTLIKYKWLFISLSSIFTFTVNKNLASPRTSIYFICFLLIFMYINILNFLKLNNSFKINNLTVNIFLFIISISGISFSLYNLQKGKELKNKMVFRENLFSKSKNKVVEVKLINPHLKSYCFNFTDFSMENNPKFNWIKDTYIDYYKLKDIIVKDFKNE